MPVASEMTSVDRRATAQGMQRGLCVLAVVLGLLCERAAHATPSIELAPCSLPDVTRPARCGSLRVPENPAVPQGRQLSIGVAIVPAIERKHDDPVVVLMGGPGESAISAAGGYVRQFAFLLQERDLLLVDQRGTGRSGALACDIAATRDPATRLKDLFPLDAVASCERRLRQSADLTQYTYPRFADDLEQVRRALGYGPLNLFAGSYGTRAEQVYVRAYPRSVRTAYVGSVVPLDVATPLTMARTAQSTLDQLIQDCAADAACRAAFPNFKDELRNVFAKLESGAVRVTVPGHEGTSPLHKGRVAEWLRSMLYRPGDAASMPWTIHRAYQGDWRVIVDGIQAKDSDPDFSYGLLFAITCSEDIPFIREAEVGPQSQGTFVGDDRVRQQQAACRLWPRATLPPHYREPVHTSVPSLFVTGDHDGDTPLWFTPRVMAGFSQAVEIVAKGQGHTEWNACIARLYEQLVRSGSMDGLRQSTCAPVPLPPFKTR
jgi:pimeloyl-ACP methyl ester carboxylesterase